MTDAAEVLNGGPQWHDDTSRRAAAFRAAGRHTARVRALKSIMVFGSLALVAGVVFFTFFDPFRKMGEITDFSVGAIGFDGSKVTMERPHLAGFRQDGRPYDMRARTMTQDLKKPNAFDLVGIDGVIGMGDKGSATVTANTGHYDNSLNSMELMGNVHVRSNAGYEAFLQNANIDFKTSHVTSNKPVRASMNSTTVVSDAIEVTDSGKHLIFIGHVRSRFVPQRTAGDTTAGLKGTSQ